MREYMKSFRLEPGDTLVEVNEKGDLFNRIKRWGLGSPYDHVFTYLGRLVLSGRVFSEPWIPVIIESDGHGVTIKSLSYRYGHKVVVLRLSSAKEGERVAYEAIFFADDPSNFYDYLCIVRSIIPRLLYEKLGIPLQLIPPCLRYQRDSLQICSEAVLEIHLRAGIDLLPLDVVPLPGDFITSPALQPIKTGVLCEDWI